MPEVDIIKLTDELIAGKKPAKKELSPEEKKKYAEAFKIARKMGGIDKKSGSKSGEGYIWEENKVQEVKYFPQDLLKNKIFFGLLFPKIEEKKDKMGNITGKHQVFTPRIVSSGLGVKSLTQRFREDYNIQFRTTPTYLPRRWKLEDIKEYVDGKKKDVDKKELINSISNQYEKYLFIRNPIWYKVHAVWDIGTYLHMLFSAYPFIELRGIAGTGKTKSMIISSLVSFNGSEIMVNPSESTLFREKEEIRGTTYFDEAEKLWIYNKATRQYEGDTRTELINASYSKAGQVPRQEKIGNKFVTKWYSPYGPTQLGSINGLFGATLTRALTRITTKSPNDDNRGEKEPEDDRQEPIWGGIRDRCYRFALDHCEEIKEIYMNFPKDVGLKRRDLQLWRPLLSVAKFIDEELYQEILSFAKELTNRKIDDLIHESSFDYMILAALKEKIISSSSEKIYVESIKYAFCDAKGDEDGKKDIYLNRNISKHLDNLGFRDLRDRDRNGAYFSVNQDIFNEIVAPSCPILAFISSPSSPSSHSCVKQQQTSDDSMTICDDKKNEDVTIVTINDDNDDTKNMNTSKKDIDFSEMEVPKSE